MTREERNRLRRLRRRLDRFCTSVGMGKSSLTRGADGGYVIQFGKVVGAEWSPEPESASTLDEMEKIIERLIRQEHDNVLHAEPGVRTVFSRLLK